MVLATCEAGLPYSPDTAAPGEDLLGAGPFTAPPRRATLGYPKATQAECLLGARSAVQGQFCISQRGFWGTNVSLWHTPPFQAGSESQGSPKACLGPSGASPYAA